MKETLGRMDDGRGDRVIRSHRDLRADESISPPARSSPCSISNVAIVVILDLASHERTPPSPARLARVIGAISSTARSPTTWGAARRLADGSDLVASRKSRETLRGGGAINLTLERRERHGRRRAALVVNDGLAHGSGAVVQRHRTWGAVIRTDAALVWGVEEIHCLEAGDEGAQIPRFPARVPADQSRRRWHAHRKRHDRRRILRCCRRDTLDRTTVPPHLDEGAGLVRH